MRRLLETLRYAWWWAVDGLVVLWWTLQRRIAEESYYRRRYLSAMYRLDQLSMKFDELDDAHFDLEMRIKRMESDVVSNNVEVEDLRAELDVFDRKLEDLDDQLGEVAMGVIQDVREPELTDDLVGANEASLTL